MGIENIDSLKQDDDVGHKLNNVYQESAYSWAAVCSCGWKEKGQTEQVVRVRFIEHQKMPHKK